MPIKEIPLLFKKPMVRAIFNDDKTETRRIMKVQPPTKDHILVRSLSDKKSEYGKYFWHLPETTGQDSKLFSCPYGEPGDRFWVKETYAQKKNSFDLLYRADGDYKDEVEKWKPSIFMPRTASRLILENTGIRTERLQDISEASAESEGIEIIDHNCYRNYLVDKEWFYKGENALGYHAVEDPIMSYMSLWDLINGIGSSDLNPMVWVIQFKKAF